MSDDRSRLALKTPPVPADALSSKSISQRAAIYAGGPVFSLILAMGICGSSLALFGEIALPGAYSAKPEVIFASLLGGFSLLVGLFNLIPIPPLDGGSLALLAIEAMAGKPISERNRQILCTAGLALITIVSAPIAFFAIHRAMADLMF